MLQLIGIKKDYKAGSGEVHALKGIDLKFRHAEFVSILGPSGCGKTTMLNIIGGLDRATGGDLIINGRSTKRFKARDWDGYRNHSIGFVFQTYNLIPHQSVLSNVELALTLTGVSKKERRQRAREALIKVGLEDQINKKPNTLSGGQMQRVAIARALVNDPDIILADEPTGALDSETSVQVMDILKEVSRDRLVIMVTHNPELAEQYSTRIIKMLDGVIRDDSMPLSKEEIAYEKRRDRGYPADVRVSDIKIDTKDNVRVTAKKAKKKKPAMSIFTSFGLSLKNLVSKKGRTILTSFAGSIGIIGIALILAISTGMTEYIDDVQEETLSSYPITLRAVSIDLTTVMETFMGANSVDVTHDMDGVYRKSSAYDIVNAFNTMEQSENDLVSFNKYLNEQMSDSEGEINGAINGVQYSYDLDLQIYTKNVDGKIEHADSEELLSELLLEHMGLDLEAMTSFGGMNAFSSIQETFQNPRAVLWQEMIPGKNGEPVNELITRQYDLVYGSWPEEYNEVALVLDENNEMDDITLYALGLISKSEMDEMMQAAVDGDTLEEKTDSWTYEDICNSEYRVILNADCYSYNDQTERWEDLRDTSSGLRYLYDQAIPLKVTGVIKPDAQFNTTVIQGSIVYTSGLTEYVINNADDSEIIEEQKADERTDVLSGLPFKDNTKNLTDKEKESEFKLYVENMDDAKKAETYIKIKSIPDDEFVDEQEENIVGDMTREDMEETILSAYTEEMSITEEEIKDYLAGMDDEELDEIFREMIREQVKAEYAMNAQAELQYMTPEALTAALDSEIDEYTLKEYAKYYDEIVEFSETTYEDNLKAMGDIDLGDPSAINIYASSFENKEIITDMIAEYNDGVSELYKIKYTDYVGILMRSVTTIINAITYVLIAFVAISLIVSSIMIGVITLISVQERTKEIGILRAIGASKRNVSSLFNAETLIIGFASGLIGVVVTFILCIPINIILHNLTGITNLGARLPIPAAVALVVISMILTLLAGIIPSRSAAKKDPAVALRTE